jgi:hypothetical protein
VKVLACVSGIGRGHAARSRPLLEALVARGHDCVAATPGRRAAALLEDVCPVLSPPPDFGAAVAPVRREPMAYTLVYDFEMAFAHYQRDVRASTTAVVAYMASAVDAVRPDVVVIDQISPASAVARDRGVAVVQVTHGPLVPGCDPWAFWLGARPAELQVPPVLPAVNDALATAHVAPIHRIDELLEGDLLLIPGSEVMGTAEGALHVDLPALLPPDELEHPQLPRGSRPRVAVLLATARTQVAETVRGIVAAGGEALVVEGHAAAAESGPAVTILGRVDIKELLPSVAAVVHHGGAGSVLESLAAGTPSVAIPNHTEQEFNSRRLVATGAGILVPVNDGPLETLRIHDGLVTLGHRHTSDLAARVTAALADLLNGTHAEAAARQRAAASTLIPVEAAADAIESLVR